MTATTYANLAGWRVITADEHEALYSASATRAVVTIYEGSSVYLIYLAPPEGVTVTRSDDEEAPEPLLSAHEEALDLRHWRARMERARAILGRRIERVVEELEEASSGTVITVETDLGPERTDVERYTLKRWIRSSGLWIPLDLEHGNTGATRTSRGIVATASRIVRGWHEATGEELS